MLRLPAATALLVYQGTLPLGTSRHRIPYACVSPDVSAGECMSAYTEHSFPSAAVENLFTLGYAVLDDAFTTEESDTLEMAMRLIDDGIMLQEEAQDGRDDAIRFVDEQSAMLPIQDAMRKLKGYGESLQSSYTIARAKEDSAWSAPWTSKPGSGTIEQLTPRLPATSMRLLTAAPVAQLASYPPGGVYCVHSDNSRDETGKRRNERALTAILYANPSDWSDDDGGHLRIWTNTDEVDCNVGDPSTLGETLRATSAACVDVLPLPGRVVFFRSSLAHEVCPSVLRPRRAITQWFFAPYNED